MDQMETNDSGTTANPNGTGGEESGDGDHAWIRDLVYTRPRQRPVPAHPYAYGPRMPLPGPSGPSLYATQSQTAPSQVRTALQGPTPRFNNPSKCFGFNTLLGTSTSTPSGSGNLAQMNQVTRVTPTPGSPIGMRCTNTTYTSSPASSVAAAASVIDLDNSFVPFKFDLVEDFVLSAGYALNRNTFRQQLAINSFMRCITQQEYKDVILLLSKYFVGRIKFANDPNPPSDYIRDYWINKICPHYFGCNIHHKK